MKYLGLLLLPLLVLAAGCADQESRSGSDATGVSENSADSDAAVILEPEDIAANNVIIDHNGSASSIGPISGRPFGAVNPETGKVVWTGAPGRLWPSGPTIVYIFKSLPIESVEFLKEFEIEVDENTAYLLPYGAEIGIDAFKEMQRIGPIDPTLSNLDLAALFGVGGDGGDPLVMRVR
jgi:hypothetical protein